jgi:endo-1,4-beta-xylanase
MAVMTHRALSAAGLTLNRDNGSKVFADSASIAYYARESVSAMQQSGIINGMPDGSFAPKAAANRAQAAVILYQLLRQI